MYIQKLYYFSRLNFGITLNNSTKKIAFVAILPILFLLANGYHFANANAQSLSDIIKQTQSDIQSAIKSSSNAKNCSNNISIQSQTNENGKTTSTSKSGCGDTLSSSTVSDNSNLKGKIVSTDFDQNRGVIVNSLTGNWSLTTKTDGSKDFKSIFTKQPVSFDIASHNSSSKVLTGSLIKGTKPTNNAISNPVENRNSNLTSYSLSNFKVNSIQQQNSDSTYKGTIDAVKIIHSNNKNISDETNNFKGIGISVSIIDDRVLVINFDKQSKLYEEFINIPLVGLIT